MDVALNLNLRLRLGALGVLALVVLAFSLVAAWSTNLGPAKSLYLPPYHYVPGDYWSYLNGFFFSVVFSLLFFGASAPIAMAIEGAKYGSLLSAGAMPAFDLLFLLPSAVGMLAAATLGQGILADYRNQGSLFDYWAPALLYFNIALLLLFITLFARATAAALGWA